MSYYIFQDDNKKFEIIITDILSKSGGTAIVYNVQGTDEFVFKLYKDKKYATKSEAKLKQFISGFPSTELDSMTNLPIKVHQLAWPKNIVYEKNKPVGFLMPKISFKDTIQLNRIFSIKNRKSEKITEDITWRITVARNLADVYNTLHQSGYYVIDTKPANIRTYKMMAAVCLLDCDGFKLKNSPFEGDMITHDYIAPESIGKPPSQLGREQDIFALSVIIFQLLNNGIHPYSGILNKNETLPIQERIKQSAYAYGKVQNRIQKPSPATIHHLFPTKLLDMFARIFEKGERPEASEWVSILDDLKKPSALSKCNKCGHKGFKKGCPTCAFKEFEKKIKKGSSSQDNKSNKPSSSNSGTISSGPWGYNQNNTYTKSNNNNPLKFFGAVAVFMIVGLFLFNNYDDNNFSENLITINNNNSSDCSDDPIKCSDNQLCNLGTNNNKWETSYKYKKYVNLARERGLSCGINKNFNNDNDTKHISGSWEAKYKCRIQIEKIINNEKFIVMYDRNSIETSLTFSIDQSPFYLGKSINLQVDNLKQLRNATTDKNTWESGKAENVITTVDLSFYTGFVDQLIKGNYLVVENNDYKLHVSLRGFSAAYNKLSPTYECG